MREYIYKSIRPEVWKRITSVIKDYATLKKDYDVLKFDIYHNEVRRKVDAYNSLWEETDDDLKEIIIYRYVCKKTFLEMEEYVFMCEKTIRRKTRNFIFKLGERLGEIDGNH